MFNVGDEVKVVRNIDDADMVLGLTGTIIRNDFRYGTYAIDFHERFNQVSNKLSRTMYGHNLDGLIDTETGWHVSIDAIELAGPPLTTEEIVDKRIKTLWNKSSYVKHHPELAY